MNKFKFEKFLKITKIDDEERMVFGYASTPEMDSDGEIIKVEALEKALPDYLQFPTLREMHQAKAIGVTKNAEIRNGKGQKEGLYIGAKVVSDEAWKLVKEGVYKAFSIGGNVVKRVGKVIEDIDLIEISLVDVPANKGAVVELWKRGKMSKDAETAYAMANLMIEVKDMIYYYEYLGKDTTKLTSILESIKELLATEASEPEQSQTENGIFEGKTLSELQAKIKMLEQLDFEKGSIADSIRKGVILNMKKAAIKKEEEVKEETPETPVEGDEETESTEGSKVEETEGTEGEEESNEESEEETENESESEEEEESEEETDESEKETGKVESALEKIENAGKTLSKLNITKKVEKKEELDTVKAVVKMADTISEMVEVVKSLGERLEKVENTPAATKSKTIAVKKTIGDDANSSDKEESEELKSLRKKLADLDTKFEELGPNQFAQQGFSKEASIVQEKIAVLEAKASK